MRDLSFFPDRALTTGRAIGTALVTTTFLTQTVPPFLVELSQGTVLDDILKQGIELVLQTARLGQGGGGSEFGRIPTKGHTKAHPRTDLVVHHCRRVLTEFNGGLTSRHEILQIELVVAVAVAIHGGCEGVNV